MKRRSRRNSKCSEDDALRFIDEYMKVLEQVSLDAWKRGCEKAVSDPRHKPLPVVPAEPA